MTAWAWCALSMSFDIFSGMLAFNVEWPPVFHVCIFFRLTSFGLSMDGCGCIVFLSYFLCSVNTENEERYFYQACRAATNASNCQPQKVISTILSIHDHPWIVQGWDSSQVQDPLAMISSWRGARTCFDSDLHRKTEKTRTWALKLSQT